MKRLIVLTVVVALSTVFANPVDIDLSPPVSNVRSIVDYEGNAVDYLLSGEDYGFSLVLTFNEIPKGAFVVFHLSPMASVTLNGEERFSVDVGKVKFVPFSLRYEVNFRFREDPQRVQDAFLTVHVGDSSGKIISNVLRLSFKLGPSRRITCDDVECVLNAMKSAKPGYLIELEPGVYEGKLLEEGGKSFYFHIPSSGSEEAPIIIRSLDPSSPAILQGETVDKGYGLYITGDHIVLENIAVRNAQKGIVLDNANWNVLKGCEVYGIGDEGIHIRDGSSHNLITGCWVHDTGKREGRKGYGEGIYIGSAWKTVKKSGYYPVCSYNVVRDSRIGPGVTAEHLDVKEFTFGTVIEHNVFYGEGISGEHYADSFIDLKGNSALVKWNVFYRQGNDKIRDAVQVHDVVKNGDWGYGNYVFGNVFFMDSEKGYIVNASSGSVRVLGNVRIPSGDEYKGRVEKEEIR